MMDAIAKGELRDFLRRSLDAVRDAIQDLVAGVPRAGLGLPR